MFNPFRSLAVQVSHLILDSEWKEYLATYDIQPNREIESFIQLCLWLDKTRGFLERQDIEVFYDIVKYAKVNSKEITTLLDEYIINHNLVEKREEESKRKRNQEESQHEDKRENKSPKIHQIEDYLESLQYVKERLTTPELCKIAFLLQIPNMVELPTADFVWDHLYRFDLICKETGCCPVLYRALKHIGSDHLAKFVLANDDRPVTFTSYGRINCELYTRMEDEDWKWVFFFLDDKIPARTQTKLLEGDIGFNAITYIKSNQLFTEGTLKSVVDILFAKREHAKTNLYMYFKEAITTPNFPIFVALPKPQPKAKLVETEPAPVVQKQHPSPDNDSGVCHVIQSLNK